MVVHIGMGKNVNSAMMTIVFALIKTVSTQNLIKIQDALINMAKLQIHSQLPVLRT